MLLADAYHAGVDLPAVIERMVEAIRRRSCAGPRFSARIPRSSRCSDDVWPRRGVTPISRMSESSSSPWARRTRREQARPRWCPPARPAPMGGRRGRLRHGPHPDRRRRRLSACGCERAPPGRRPWFLAHGRITDRSRIAAALISRCRAPRLPRSGRRPRFDRFDEAQSARVRGLKPRPLPRKVAQRRPASP